MQATYVILGATGHVGGATARTLLEQGEKVIAVVRDAKKGERLQALGAEIAEVDLRNADALRAVFRRGRRAFLMNPPAPPSTDVDVEELRTVHSILLALDGSGLENVVALSTMGAQPGERIGDLSVLWALEEGLRKQSIPCSIIRGAYYMSNWDMQVDSAREKGSISTMVPLNFMLPMVAADDLGRIAAKLLKGSLQDTAIHNIEGPARYSARDVAAAFSVVLNRPVEAVATPRSGWAAAFHSFGFSEAAAESYTRMTAATVDQPMVPEAETEKGVVTLEEYLKCIAEKNQ